MKKLSTHMAIVFEGKLPVDESFIKTAFLVLIIPETGI